VNTKSLGISVVIPLYNKAKTIDKTLLSVLSQTDALFEIVIVDDGSEDDSVARVLNYKDSRIHLFKQPNAGPSVARNQGVSLAQYPYVIFLDADDRFLSGCLRKHLECFASSSAVDLSIGSFQVVTNGEVEEDKIAERLGFYTDDFVFTSINLNIIKGVPSSGFAIKKTLFNAIGGFDPSLMRWEITDFMLRATLAAQRIGLTNSVLCSYDIDTSNSQMQRTENKPEMDLLFAQRVLAQTHKLPALERVNILTIPRMIAWHLWEIGALAEFQTIANELLVYKRDGLDLHPIFYLNKSPIYLLIIIYWVYKFMQRLFSWIKKHLKLALGHEN
jgi:glycosyltransferase involved in cell wall biosynthesis